MLSVTKWRVVVNNVQKWKQSVEMTTGSQNFCMAKMTSEDCNLWVILLSNYRNGQFLCNSSNHISMEWMTRSLTLLSKQKDGEIQKECVYAYVWHTHSHTHSHTQSHTQPHTHTHTHTHTCTWCNYLMGQPVITLSTGWPFQNCPVSSKWDKGHTVVGVFFPSQKFHAISVHIKKFLWFISDHE